MRERYDWDGIHRPTLDIQDIVQFTEGIGAEQLWFSQAGNDLKVNLLDTSDGGTSYTLSDDQLLIRNWFNDGQWFGDELHEVDLIETDAGVLVNDKVDQLVQSLAQYDIGNLGDVLHSKPKMPCSWLLWILGIMDKLIGAVFKYCP
ncbi:hypothetical protein AB835_07995 [Candidatus Endobugula sertula]|uniref:Haemolysin-type calcium binding-related domain-containing protein n=1 Tax=Candidatus Endobugula sertula TaxID=62101 RepID=A0A1D2QPM2_9GAMM|nr:hypothetical protein AB835_07995 [Candidatus Endobugula sertula]